MSNFDVFKDNKEFTSLVLYKNTGLSLPKDTVLNAKYSKNLLLIEITIMTTSRYWQIKNDIIL